MIARFGKTGNVGSESPRSRSQHNLVGGNNLFADLQLSGSDEMSVLLVNGHVGETLAVFLTARRNRVYAVEHAVTDGRPVGSLEARVNAVAPAVLSQFGQLGGVDQHLGRYAANVEAGSAEQATFDDGDIPIVVFRVDNRVSRSGTDDDQIK